MDCSQRYFFSPLCSILHCWPLFSPWSSLLLPSVMPYPPEFPVLCLLFLSLLILFPSFQMSVRASHENSLLTSLFLHCWLSVNLIRSRSSKDPLCTFVSQIYSTTQLFHLNFVPSWASALAHHIGSSSSMCAFGVSRLWNSLTSFQGPVITTIILYLGYWSHVPSRRPFLTAVRAVFLKWK